MRWLVILGISFLAAFFTRLALTLFLFHRSLNATGFGEEAVSALAVSLVVAAVLAAGRRRRPR